MQIAEWKQAWNLAITAFAGEPIQIRVVIALAIALMTLMMIEGIRASFFPRRKRKGEPASHPTQSPPQPKAMAAATGAKQPFVPRDTARATLYAKRKAVRERPRTQRGLLPKIHRRESAARTIEPQKIPQFPGEDGERPNG